jgi:N-acyl-L-homoserine lactone synthetase
MERRGMPRDMLAVGTTATVIGYPHRSEADEMRAERLTIAAKTVELR